MKERKTFENGLDLVLIALRRLQPLFFFSKFWPSFHVKTNSLILFMTLKKIYGLPLIL